MSGSVLTPGRKLKSSLAGRGRTQAWLARQLGVTNAQVSYWVNDKRLPRLDQAFRIAKLLQVDAGWLWADAGLIRDGRLS